MRGGESRSIVDSGAAVALAAQRRVDDRLVEYRLRDLHFESLESVRMAKLHKGKAPQGIVRAVAFRPLIDYSLINKSRPSRESLPHARRYDRLSKGLPEISRHVAHEAMHRHLCDAVADDRIHGSSHGTQRWFVNAGEIQLRFG
jgi:hypothetical protein